MSLQKNSVLFYLSSLFMEVTITAKARKGFYATNTGADKPVSSGWLLAPQQFSWYDVLAEALCFAPLYSDVLMDGDLFGLHLLLYAHQARLSLLPLTQPLPSHTRLNDPTR